VIGERDEIHAARARDLMDVERIRKALARRGPEQRQPEQSRVPRMNMQVASHRFTPRVFLERQRHYSAPALRKREGKENIRRRRFAVFTRQSHGCRGDTRSLAHMSGGSPSEVLLVLTDAGGGHRAAANALIAAAEEQRAPLRFRVLKLQDALAGADFTRMLLGGSMEDTYNRMVRRGRTRFLVPLLRLLHWLIARLHGPLVRMLARELLRGPRPAAVVSLMPNFNAVIRDAVRAVLPGVTVRGAADRLRRLSTPFLAGARSRRRDRRLGARRRAGRARGRPQGAGVAGFPGCRCTRATTPSIPPRRARGCGASSRSDRTISS
jgi:hypothetical protein